MRRRNALTRRHVYGSKAYKSTGRMFITALVIAAEEAGAQSATEPVNKPLSKVYHRKYKRLNRIAQAFEKWLDRHGLL